MGSITICIVCWLEAFFSVEVAFTAAKYVNLKLSLENSEVLHLGVVVDIESKASNVAKGKADISGWFGMVKRVAKGLFMRKS